MIAALDLPLIWAGLIGEISSIQVASKSFIVALSMVPTLCNAVAEAWIDSNASLLNFRFVDIANLR